MFAPAFHPAMKRVMGTRRDLGVPTIFNILGPLTNPAGARAQVIGVNRADLVEVVSRVIALLGCDRAFVLHGYDGLDEFTISDRTIVAEVVDGSVRSTVLAPEDLGCSRASRREVLGGDCSMNVSIITDVLRGRAGPPLEVTVANAAFAIIAGGGAPSLKEGVRVARETISSGAARDVLERLVCFSREAGSRVT